MQETYDYVGLPEINHSAKVYICCNCSVITIYGTCNAISHDKRLLLLH